MAKTKIDLSEEAAERRVNMVLDGVMNGIFLTLISDARAEEMQLKDRLETEESPKILAACQGEISGIRTLFQIMIDHNTIDDFFFMQLTEPEFITDIHTTKDNDFDIAMAEIRELKSSRSWKTMEQEVSDVIEIKKGYLFYQAEKGRDLDLTHGFRDGILRLRTRIGEFETEKRFRENSMPLFNGGK